MVHSIKEACYNHQRTLTRNFSELLPTHPWCLNNYKYYFFQIQLDCKRIKRLLYDDLLNFSQVVRIKIVPLIFLKSKILKYKRSKQSWEVMKQRISTTITLPTMTTYIYIKSTSARRYVQCLLNFGLRPHDY